MTSKKSGFWTFIFSLFPGAGEMYLGFLKQGASIMILFFGIFALSAGLNLNFLIFLLPVIWCYSFFHSHNLRSMPDEEFYALEDHFLFVEPDGTYTFRSLTEFFLRYRKITAAVLIVFGCLLLWNSLLDYLYGILPEPLYHILAQFSYNLPQIFFSILIILFGIHLINGKRQQMDDTADFFPDDEDWENPSCDFPTQEAEADSAPALLTPQPASQEQEAETPKESDDHDENA